MEHARVTTLTADPARLEDVVDYVQHKVLRRIEQQPGSRGLTLAVQDELGVAVATSFWVSGDALRESERPIAESREEAARRGNGTASVERFEVASMRRIAHPRPGAGVRLTRVDVEPSRVATAIEAYEDAALPWLVQTEGFCSSLLLVHRRSGRGVQETTWKDVAAMAATRSAAAAIRVEAVVATGAAIRALEELRLVISAVPFRSGPLL